jgi:hypothetical protein
MAQCPHCYRTIGDDVLKCPHCQGTIVRRRAAAASAASGAKPAGARGQRPAAGRAEGGRAEGGRADTGRLEGGRAPRSNLGLLFGAAVIGVVLLGGLGGAVLLVPDLLPVRQPAGPAATAAPGASLPAGATNAPPTAIPTIGATPRPPSGWRQAGGVPEGFVLWLPEDWLVYQTGLDNPDEWIATVSALDAGLAGVYALEEHRAALRSESLRLLAVHSPAGVQTGQYWPDSVNVQLRPELVGQTPEAVVQLFEQELTAAYGERGLKLLGHGVTRVRNYSASRVEYTYSQEIAPGAALTVHGATLALFDAASPGVYVVHVESSHGRYNTVSAQAFSRIVSNFRFDTPAAVTLTMPADWREVRSAAHGFVLWLPGDWLAYERGADDLAGWSEQVRAGYPLGDLFLNAFGDQLGAWEFIALEPPARERETVWLASVTVDVNPAFAGWTTRQLADYLPGYAEQHPELSVQIERSDLIWQHGRPGVYRQYRAMFPVTVEEKAVFRVVELALPVEGGALILSAYSLEQDLATFEDTFDLVAKSLELTR